MFHTLILASWNKEVIHMCSSLSVCPSVYMRVHVYTIYLSSGDYAGVVQPGHVGDLALLVGVPGDRKIRVGNTSSTC